jgi:hypothetical protein
VSVALCRGGASFCTRGAIQGYDVVLFILALAKTVTPAGAPGGAGAACAAWHFTVLFSKKVLAAQKAMTYTDLLGAVAFDSIT